jgi:type II secretory pathway component PulC
MNTKLQRQTGAGLSLLFIGLAVYLGMDNLMSLPDVRAELFRGLGNEETKREAEESYVFQPNPFGETARPQVLARKPGKPVEGMRLNGVAVSSNPKESTAFINIPNSHESRPVKVGQNVNGYRCDRIEEDRVILKHKSHQITLKLFETDGLKVISTTEEELKEKKEMPSLSGNVSEVLPAKVMKSPKVSREEVKEFRKSIKNLSPEQKREAFRKKAEQPGWKKAFQRLRGGKGATNAPASN